MSAGSRSESATRHLVAVDLVGVPPAGSGIGRRRVTRWLEALIAELAPGASSFCARFVDDPQMRALNREWRGKDHPTDVLSFPGEETPEGEHLGDVVISLETARRQAATAHRSLAEEVQVLLLHGLLHCTGLDHETDAGEMEDVEAGLRRRWIVPGAPWTVSAGAGR